MHLLLPDDLDLEAGWLHVRNKPNLGWQVKTRNERDIPMISELVDVLRLAIGNRTAGPLFRQRRFSGVSEPPLAGLGQSSLQREMACRIRCQENAGGRSLDRTEVLRATRTNWRDLGGFRMDIVRKEFMAITAMVDMPFVHAKHSVILLPRLCKTRMSTRHP